MIQCKKKSSQNCVTMKQLQYATGIKFSIKKYTIFLKRFHLPRDVSELYFLSNAVSRLFLYNFFPSRWEEKNKFIQLFGALEAAQVELSYWIYSITQVICEIFFVNCVFSLTNMIIAKKNSRNINKWQRKSFGVQHVFCMELLLRISLRIRLFFNQISIERKKKLRGFLGLL